MSDFVDSSNCKGCRPKKLGLASYYSRKHLVSKLMRDRSSLRLVIAPSHFGKSFLIAEYAELVFSFEDVFWVDGSSPCFLRDLDDGVLFEDFFKEGQLPSLVVIDDIAVLDTSRAQFAQDNLLRLVSLGCEVIVSMGPSGDTFERHNEEIIRLEAQELLLSDEELDYRRTKSEQIMRPSNKFTPFERIPFIAWGESKDELKILASLTEEGLCSAELLACFVMIILGRGSYEDVMNFIEGPRDDAFDLRLRHYAYLGMNPAHEEFACHAFSLEAVARVFVPHLEHMGTCSRFSAKGALIARLADASLGRGSPELACDVVRLFATASHRGAWLGSRGHLLLSRGCIYSAHRLYQSLKPEKSSSRSQLALAEARRLYLLGQKEAAFRSAARILSLCDASGSLGMEAALLLARSPKDTDEASVRTFLNNALAEILGPSQTLDKDLVKELISRERSWHIAALFEWCLREKPTEASHVLKACFEAGATKNLLTHILLRILGTQEDSLPKNQIEVFNAFENDEEIIGITCEFLNSCYQKKEIGFLEACLAHALLAGEDSRESDPCGPPQHIKAMHLLDEGILRLTDAYHASLLEQVMHMEQEILQDQRRREAYALAHPDGLRKSSSHTQHVQDERTPVLSVRLFGGLELTIGDSVVDLKAFSRQKTKVLLAILVLNQGREISRERLSVSLWPESTEEAARRNLHSLWALLRKALKTKDGVCPYLIRTQFSYKLNTEFVKSDIAEFNEICQKILFGQPQLFEWQHMYTRITTIYCDDILPTETKNALILSARDELRKKFVEACSYAAMRLSELHEHQLSLHFAQAALQKDVTREDAYALMMKGQIALGQRTAALDTYFRCRRYLSEELGIDPGTKTQELYLEIVVDGGEARAIGAL